MSILRGLTHIRAKILPSDGTPRTNNNSLEVIMGLLHPGKSSIQYDPLKISAVGSHPEGGSGIRSRACALATVGLNTQPVSLDPGSRGRSSAFYARCLRGSTGLNAKMRYKHIGTIGAILIGVFVLLAALMYYFNQGKKAITRARRFLPSRLSSGDRSRWAY
jgi:hypothetical protein